MSVTKALVANGRYWTLGVTNTVSRLAILDIGHLRTSPNGHIHDQQDFKIAVEKSRPSIPGTGKHRSRLPDRHIIGLLFFHLYVLRPLFFYSTSFDPHL